MVVFWNMNGAEREKALATLGPFEEKPYPKGLVESEVERVDFVVSE